MKKPLTKEFVDSVSHEVIGAAIEVNKHIGTGLLESIYHNCMEEELRLRGLDFVSQMKIPVVYKGKKLDAAFRCDFFVENCLIVELKACKEFTPVFEAQVFTYMNLMEAPKGLLINFNVKNIFYRGQRTFVNEIYRQLPEK